MPSLSLTASQPHYLDHLAPVWHALPSECRGQVQVLSGALVAHAASLGLEPVTTTPLLSGDALLAAGWIDTVGRRGKVALLEHGAGQTYDRGDKPRHGSYSGGVGRDNISLFLCPSETVARRNLAAYPEAEVAVVGCPKLDRYHPRPPGFRASDQRVVAVSFHWSGGGIAPEARWTLPHYKDVLPELIAWAKRENVSLLGHGHPRARHRLQALWRKLDVPWTTDDHLLRYADVLIIDNSSLGYEFVSVGGEVLWLNAPWYRRNVWHGLRFWDCVPGWQVSEPGDLLTGLEESFNNPVAQNFPVTPNVYAYNDDRCAWRAATALRRWLKM